VGCLAQCRFCKSQFPAPENVMGLRVLCPRCGYAQALGPPAPPAVALRPPAPRPARRKAAARVRAAPARRAASARHTRWRGPGRVSLFGLGGLLLTVAALICSALPPLCALTGLLAASALLCAFTGLVRAIALRNASLVWPVAGVLASSCVLIIAAAFPGLLGDAYRSFREKPVRDTQPPVIVTDPTREAAAGTRLGMVPRCRHTPRA